MDGQLIIIEDDEGSRYLFEYLLKQAGFAIRTFREGTPALQFIREHPPRLVIVDMLLPDMDGLELLRELHSLPQTATIPTVLVSAHLTQDECQHVLDAGATRFIEKPIDPDAFVQQIRAVLSSPRN